MTSIQPATTPASNSSSRVGSGAIYLMVAAAAAVFFGSFFNHESSLSYSIGYNLYGAERVLGGEVPYRDFHTLYPPATVYLNAILFKLAGVGLYPALAGVCIFKVLTVVAVYGCARRLLPVPWALAASVYTLLWLRPNGPFKAVPMHYGAVFLAASLLFLLRFLTARKSRDSLICGLALGVLILFKHNIGIYALLGCAAVIVLDDDGFRALKANLKVRTFNVAVLALGCLIPVLPVAAYMAKERALVPMLKTLLFGPGEFLLRRLATTPSPLFAGLAALAVLALIVAAYKIGKSNIVACTLLLALAFVVALAYCFITPESKFSEAVFYAPVAIVVLGLAVWWKADLLKVERKSALLALVVAAAAALMESFPRFAREQAIASGPFIGLLAVYLAFVLQPAMARAFTGRQQRALAISILPIILFAIGVRIFHETYFAGFHFRSNTQLAVDRGRGVYFPPDTADEIDRVVRYIQNAVPEGGYVFAQSYAGSSFLFLSDRRNPSAAQFWGGVGVTLQEKRETLDAVKRDDVRLIVSSAADLENESYEPMREYITGNFHPAQKFGRVIILERTSYDPRATTP